ncbi:PfkB family carbohydrate kinase [Streptomyces sp. 8K308]|uniref:PfkB family carbohydrate kinase n=1 Tax=Streptomyces sp. 8K308 TaxID=2530388 RepID=UPI001405261B|nr:PfkB family carbohydrate kinase [Streptomyces sp. 8K308]
MHVVGSLNADQLLELSVFPERGETVLSSGTRVTAGGKGGNQAVAAARAGARTAMVGVTGDDAHGRLVRAALAEAGVGTAAVRADPEAPTGLAVVLLEPGGGNRIIVASGANNRVGERDVEAGLAAVEPGDVVLLQLEIPPATVAHAARRARARGATVMLNAAPAPTDARHLDPAYLDVLVVNAHEARAVARLFGVTEGAPEDQAPSLARALDALVVCTAGDRGAYAVPAGGREPVLHVPAVPVPAVDTTAAGDTFTGYLAAALAEGANASDLPAALHRAAAAAALAVTRHGAAESIPDLDEVLRTRFTSPLTSRE